MDETFVLFLNDIPSDMQGFVLELDKELKEKGIDCKKLNGLNCSPSCPGGYTFTMDGVEYRKCKNTAFFHDLCEENCEYIKKLIETS